MDRVATSTWSIILGRTNGEDYEMDTIAETQ